MVGITSQFPASTAAGARRLELPHPQRLPAQVGLAGPAVASVAWIPCMILLYPSVSGFRAAVKLNSAAQPDFPALLARPYQAEQLRKCEYEARKPATNPPVLIGPYGPGQRVGYGLGNVLHYGAQSIAPGAGSGLASSRRPRRRS